MHDYASHIQSCIIESVQRRETVYNSFCAMYAGPSGHYIEKIKNFTKRSLRSDKTILDKGKDVLRTEARDLRLFAKLVEE